MPSVHCLCPYTSKFVAGTITASEARSMLSTRLKLPPGLVWPHVLAWRSSLPLPLCISFPFHIYSQPSHPTSPFPVPHFLSIFIWYSPQSPFPFPFYSLSFSLCPTPSPSLPFSLPLPFPLFLSPILCPCVSDSEHTRCERMQDDMRQVRSKDSKDRATVEQVMDPRTRAALQRLINNLFLLAINGCCMRPLDVANLSFHLGR